MGAFQNTFQNWFQNWALVKQLLFDAPENQTAVGQIIEPLATSFNITEGEVDFNITTNGIITFKTAPDYEIKNLYTLRVISDRATRYAITVNVTDVLSPFVLLTATNLVFETAF